MSFRIKVWPAMGPIAPVPMSTVHWHSTVSNIIPASQRHIVAPNPDEARRRANAVLVRYQHSCPLLLRLEFPE